MNTFLKEISFSIICECGKKLYSLTDDNYYCHACGSSYESDLPTTTIENSPYIEELDD